MMAVWSKIEKSKLHRGSRIDAEFYQPQYLHDNHTLSSCNHKRLGDLLKLFYRYPTCFGFEFADDGVPFLKGEDIDSTGFVHSKSGDCMSQEISDRFPRTVLDTDDIIITVRGYVGKVGLIGKDMKGSQISPNLIRAKVDLKEIDPTYLWVFLNCGFGQRQFERYKMRTSQETIVSTDMKDFLIAIPTERTKQAVHEFVASARSLLQGSNNLYAEAEQLLECALGLDKVDLTPRLFCERSYADVAAAARFDAEYYQPPKKAVIDALARMPGEPVTTQFRPVRDLWQPNEANPNDQVRNYNLTEALQPSLDDTVEPTTPDTIFSTKKRLKPGDLVVSRLRSYLKEIAVVQDAGPFPMVGSTEFIVLRPRKNAIAVETLLVYLRSRYVQTVLKWSQDGSNHPRFDVKELLSIRIPDVVREHESDITSNVRKSFSARREAHRLLDEAKAMVETAILCQE